ncbi:MAG: FAD-binding oxidoreductase [Hydrogenophilus sp.]|nr:FAD-binding oxidoreductase [Hydrogenophilus sp.]
MRLRMEEEEKNAVAAALEAEVPGVEVVYRQEQLLPLLREYRGRFVGEAAAAVFPRSVAEVQAVLRWASRRGVAVTPQGGNTGLVGGATPLRGRGAQVVLCLQRLNRIRRVDPAAMTLTAEAGVRVAEVQAAAAEVGRWFPLSLASEESATLGGVIATNAGGVHVVRYGTMRALLMGVEVVLADGTLVARLDPPPKDNAGYFWPALLAGSEGTLGVVTAATVRLAPKPRWQQTVWAALPSLEAGVALWMRAQTELGERLVAFEVMGERVMRLVQQHTPGGRWPWEPLPPWAALVEFADTVVWPAGFDPTERFWEAVFAEGVVLDAIVAEGERQRREFWRWRESASEAQRRAGESVKHDVALPLAQLVEFVKWGEETLPKAFPGVRVVCFGHLGDGNLHYNVFLPEGLEGETAAAWRREITARVHAETVARGGSFAAEHGVGCLKVEEMKTFRPTEELELMRRLKEAFDPAGILNPGKVLPPRDPIPEGGGR